MIQHTAANRPNSGKSFALLLDVLESISLESLREPHEPAFENHNHNNKNQNMLTIWPTNPLRP